MHVLDYKIHKDKMILKRNVDQVILLYQVFSKLFFTNFAQI